MPKSKRQRVTTLSKTPLRTTKSSKQSLVNEIRSAIEANEHVWLFSVGDMRNDALKDVRAQWRGTGRLFLGRGRVMGKALGTTAADEFEAGLAPLGRHVRGQVGLFVTSHDVVETQAWFESYVRPAYARQNAIATRTVTLPAGPLRTPFTTDRDADGQPLGDPFPHSMDPQLRALGLDTVLVRGVPSLRNETVLCREGEKLSSEKCRVLKLLGVQMSEFKITLGSRWTRGEGFVAGAELDGGASDGEMDEDA
ncbi:mRNA turnover and ribosome assembly protein [Cryptotrichosporon argae]